MRALRFLSLAILLTLVATSISMFAQDEKTRSETTPAGRTPSGSAAGRDEASRPR